MALPNKKPHKQNTSDSSFSLLHSIILTGGDPAGISPEIIPDAIAEWHQTRNSNSYLVYFSTASKSFLEVLRLRFKELEFIVIEHQVEETINLIKHNKFIIQTGQILVFDLASSQTPKHEIKLGQPDETTGKLALQALQNACIWIDAFGTQGLVTAPLAKNYVDLSFSEQQNTTFSGHTGFLADWFKSDVVMLMHGPDFSVIPLTTHIALTDVSKTLQKLLSGSELIPAFKILKKLPIFSESNWAVCSLNPHAGEDGLMGQEELTYLNKWCCDLRETGYLVDGPLPSDTLFTKDILKKYRLIFSCYHDQGLIPFKSIVGTKGINVTIGLPFLRTSPDHGTAFNIAGRGCADSKSMVLAMRVLLSGELQL